MDGDWWVPEDVVMEGEEQAKGFPKCPTHTWRKAGPHPSVISVRWGGKLRP